MSLPDASAYAGEEPVVEAMTSATGSQVLLASKAYASARDGLACWQVASTFALLLGVVAAFHALAWTPLRCVLAVLFAGLVVRLFVLQHDCTHLSFLSARRANDVVGTLISFITGIGFLPWRLEHNWHHAHSGKLSQRGVDPNTSPPTCAEATAAPDEARKRARFVSPWTIFLMGTYTLVYRRKRLRGYFFYRPAYQGRVPQPQKLARGLWLSNTGYVAWNLALAAWLGPWGWLGLVLPGTLMAAGFGTSLFWVQHNFEDTHYAEDTHWDFVRAGLEGSSYLKLPALLAWFSGNIGIHHVHHLNVRIPNYRLEEARRGVPALCALVPLNFRQWRDCYTHLFWDEQAERLVTLDEALSPSVSNGDPVVA